MPTRVEIVQARLGIPPTGRWDAVTDGAVLAYQRAGLGQAQMAPHGHTDAATMVNLGYYAPTEIFPGRWGDYLAGGERPGTFGRDMSTAINQVPRWAWIGMTVTFGLFAYLAWRGDKKRGAT